MMLLQILLNWSVYIYGETLTADCPPWFGIDRLCAYVRVETLIADGAHWFGVD